MNSNLIFFDIDGTILSHRTFTISDSTRAAIKQAQAKGNLAFLNTGRTLAEMGDDILNVGFDGGVYGCGTCIVYHGDVLYHVTISTDMIPALQQDLRNCKIEAILEGSSAIYYDKEYTNPVARQIKYDHMNRHDFTVGTWETPDISFDKFCIWPSSKDGLDAFHNKYKEMFDFIDRGGNFFEVVPRGCSKATGIAFLRKHKNISYENTYALGDSSNDLPMLEYVKHSIAMGNASERVKSMASFLTKDVDDDGVAYALRHFRLI